MLMKEVTSSPKKLTMAALNKLSIGLLVHELPHLSAPDAEKLIQRKAKDFGKKPKSLIELIKTAENFPDLKSAIEKTKLIETPSLNISDAEKELGGNVTESLRELKNVVLHRKRLMLKKPRNVLPDDPLAIIAATNPDHHEKDSIEDLTTYLINNSESGFYFLRQKNRQIELAEKPVLIAKMIAGNNNLQKTIDKERTVHLLDIPKPVQEALSVFSETVTILATSQMKNDEKRHAALINNVHSIANTPALTVLPVEDIYDLNRQTKQNIIDAIETMLAALPDNETKQSLQERLNNLQQAQHTSRFYTLNENSYGLKLYDDVEEAFKKVNALRKIRGLLQDPLFLASERFTQLRPYLEKLNENNSLQEITQHNTELVEIRAKISRLRDIYAVIRELEEKEPERAEKFRLLASDFNEYSQQKPLDEFFDTIKTIRTNINLLSKAHTALEDPLLKNSPKLDALRSQLRELNLDSRKFEFENFNSELTKARKLALEAMSHEEQAHEERSVSRSSPILPQKQRSSMEKTEGLPVNNADDSPSSSYSESIEVYKTKPKKYKEPPPSDRNPHL